MRSKGLTIDAGNDGNGARVKKKVKNDLSRATFVTRIVSFRAR